MTAPMSGVTDCARISMIMICANSGPKVVSRYFSAKIPPEAREQFEQDVIRRAADEPSEQVMQTAGAVVVYRSASDLTIFVGGGETVNELILDSVINLLIDIFELVFKGNYKAEKLIQQIDLLYLILDETIENGYIFEGDPEVVAARTMLKDDTAYLGKSKHPVVGL